MRGERLLCVTVIAVTSGVTTVVVASGVTTLPLGGVRRGVVFLLNIPVISTGHALHLVAVAVVAGDLYGGVLQLVLQVAVGPLPFRE